MNGKLTDFSEGHEVPLVKPGLDLAFSTQEEIFNYPRQCAEKFGRSYRMNFFVFWKGLDIIRADDAEIILKSSKHFEKSAIYEILHPFLQTGLLTSNGDKWHQRRRMLTPAFHFDILKEYLEVFRDESDRLVEDLKQTIGSDINIIPYSTQFTLNSVCEAAMGVNLRDLGNEGKIYKEKLLILGKILVLGLIKPWLIFRITSFLMGHSTRLNALLKPIHDFTRSIYKQRFSTFQDENSNEVENSENIYFKKKRRYAMMDTLLHAQKSDLIDENGILEETDTFTFEGHDTTSAAMTFVLFLLSHHPETQESILHEINERIDEIGDENFSIEDFNKLELMDRVLKESMRIYPPVPFISRVLSEDVNFRGLTFPKGRLINIHIYDIHHDPEIYPEPDRFDPDRFLPENCATRSPFAFVAFSAGMRNCIGQRFAMLELKMMLMKVIRNFKILPITKRDEVAFIADLVLRSKNPIKIKLQSRQSTSS